MSGDGNRTRVGGSNGPDIRRQEPMKYRSHHARLLFVGMVATLMACRSGPARTLSEQARWSCGDVIERVEGVAIRSNGPGLHSCVDEADVRHRHPDGYVYGRKWQCVEFVRRFYKDHLGHEMPSAWGNAADYFRGVVAHGARNPERGLLQFQNGDSERPRPDDIVVFQDAAGAYGHVAIIMEAREDVVILAQQNALPALVTLPLSNHAGRWTIGGGATGFLRK